MLHKDHRFKQLKQVLNNLNNILISKKHLDLSQKQMQFIKIVMNESLKSEISELKSKILNIREDFTLFMNEIESQL